MGGRAHKGKRYTPGFPGLKDLVQALERLSWVDAAVHDGQQGVRISHGLPHTLHHSRVQLVPLGLQGLIGSQLCTRCANVGGYTTCGLRDLSNGNTES
jgi:hypothetical protein